jgi:nitroimidazol reductase NimA-like FMN-containing flavoprotein (pyridoxamine 5'-phosphate oxidase superfamily)
LSKVVKSQFIDDLLQAPLIARFATADLHGQPHVVPVWYGWDGMSIWISSFANTRKVKDLEQNPKVSIVIDVVIENSENKAVIFEGHVELVKSPRELLEVKFLWIYTRYMGEERVLAKEPQSWIHDPLNLLIKLTPEKVIHWNY